jgi:exodeoxyribonuclease V alpha subunit
LLTSAVVGRPGEFKPLILDAAHRLYLHRYWQYEHDLAEAIRARLNQPARETNWQLFREGVKRLLGTSTNHPKSPAEGVREGTTQDRDVAQACSAMELDWQQAAVFAALQGNLTVITGGPGTGKTRTVVVLLALLLEQAQAQGRNLRIAVAAPTGKAAARIQESIKSARATLNCPDEIKARLPDEAKTIHRLLGAREGSTSFRHDARNPLALEVVVVDEASMVDLALMSRLFAAIPPDARVILLGDKDQLASVEAGAVLGDLCHPAQVNCFSREFAERFAAVTGQSLPAESVASEGMPPANAIVQLQKNYRFGEDSGIHAISQAVNAGDGERAWRMLANLRAASGVTWRALPRPSELKPALRAIVLECFAGYLKCRDAREALEGLIRFRILSAVRHGPTGVIQMNRLAEEILAEEGLIAPDFNRPNYHGRPVLVTRNDYSVRLFNGDVGLLWESAAGAGLRAFFLGADGELRDLAPERLPEHETVFAMTVHKSQGSEFDQVLLVLPDQESPVLTRELVYTGITRARSRVKLWSSEAAFRRAVETPVRRASGLKGAVWSA